MPLCWRISLGSSPPVLANKSAVRSLRQVNLSSPIRVKSSHDRWCSTWVYLQFSQPVSPISQGHHHPSSLHPHALGVLTLRNPKLQNHEPTESALAKYVGWHHVPVLQAHAGPCSQHRPCRRRSPQLLPAARSIGEQNEWVYLSHRQLAKIADGCPRSCPQWNAWKTSKWPNIEKLPVGNIKEISSRCGPLLLYIPSTKKKSQHCWRLHDVMWHKVVNIEGLGKKIFKFSSQ